MNKKLTEWPQNPKKDSRNQNNSTTFRSYQIKLGLENILAKKVGSFVTCLSPTFLVNGATRLLFLLWVRSCGSCCG